MQKNGIIVVDKVSNLYRNYVLGMLTLVYVFNFIDRQLLVILQESIKKELHLSDTQLGLLSGFTFAIFYVTLGIPIARLADKSNRRNIVTMSLGLWSVMTALSGSARNFMQLLFARIGVGVGEAGGSPPAHAMISDYFPPEKRSTALSVYSMGIYIGILVGFLMGGFLNQHLGWRNSILGFGYTRCTFFPVVLCYGKRTTKRCNRFSDQQGKRNHPLGEVIRFLYSTNTFVWLALATGLHVFCIYGLVNWAPSFLSRLHGMKNSEIGVFLGLTFGIGGGIGTYAGGFLTDHFGKKDKSWYLKIPGYAIIVSVFFAAGAFFLQNNIISIFCLGVCDFYRACIWDRRLPWFTVSCLRQCGRFPPLSCSWCSI